MLSPLCPPPLSQVDHPCARYRGYGSGPHAGMETGRWHCVGDSPEALAQRLFRRSSTFIRDLLCDGDVEANPGPISMVSTEVAEEFSNYCPPDYLEWLLQNVGGDVVEVLACCWNHAKRVPGTERHQWHIKTVVTTMLKCWEEVFGVKPPAIPDAVGGCPWAKEVMLDWLDECPLDFTSRVQQLCNSFQPSADEPRAKRTALCLTIQEEFLGNGPRWRGRSGIKCPVSGCPHHLPNAWSLAIHMNGDHDSSLHGVISSNSSSSSSVTQEVTQCSCGSVRPSVGQCPQCTTFVGHVAAQIIANLKQGTKASQPQSPT